MKEEPVETLEDEVAETAETAETEEPTQTGMPLTQEQMALLISRLKRKIIKQEQRDKRIKKDRKKKQLLKKQRKHARNRGR